MSKNLCSVCKWEKKSGRVIDTSKSNVAWAKEIGTSEGSVRRHLGHGPRVLDGVDVDMTPGTYDYSESSDGSKSAVSAIRDRPITLEDARDWVRSSGDNPDDYNISVRSTAYGEGLFSNKQSAVPKPGKKLANLEVDIDPIAILKELRSEGSYDYFPRVGGDSTFVLSINDTQVGKKEEGRGGTPELLERFDRFLNGAIKRIAELRIIGRQIGTLVILGGGDLVEGCVIYPNQSYNIDLDRRGQINTTVGMILDAIDRLAPMFERVVVLAARGNHGEHRINGNRTTTHDNDDTLVFEMARLATDRDPELKHVEYVIADSEAGVYGDFSGWRLVVTHGDVYAKGVAGAKPDQKAHNWYKNMSAGRDPLGMADVMVGAHWHHNRSSDWGACYFRQAPAQDSGSEYFRQTSGEWSEPGMLTFVMTPENRYQDEMVLS